MTVPPARIIAVPAPTSAPPPLLPMAQVNADIDYGLDFGGVLADYPDDPIVMLTMKVKPSGTLEAVISNFTLQGSSVAAFSICSDLGARVYLIEVGATLVSGHRATALATVQFDWSSQPYPIPYPDSPDWGLQIAWGSLIPPDALLGVDGDVLTGVGGDILTGTAP
jgi:hypothetical protein